MINEKIINLSHEQYADLIAESYKQGWQSAIESLQSMTLDHEEMKTKIIRRFEALDK